MVTPRRVLAIQPLHSLRHKALAIQPLYSRMHKVLAIQPVHILRHKAFCHPASIQPQAQGSCHPASTQPQSQDSSYEPTAFFCFYWILAPGPLIIPAVFCKTMNINATLRLGDTYPCGRHLASRFTCTMFDEICNYSNALYVHDDRHKIFETRTQVNPPLATVVGNLKDYIYFLLLNEQYCSTICCI